jgi:transcriptional regulator with XRE-family HTH domain
MIYTEAHRMGKTGTSQSPEEFGKYLAGLRAATGLSLRQVEEATEKEVSNAYLSQLENCKISKPSPNILHALAIVYSASYEDLMSRAGYVSTSYEGSTERHGKVAAFAVGNLTPDEEKALLAYLAFYRNSQR